VSTRTISTSTGPTDNLAEELAYGEALERAFESDPGVDATRDQEQAVAVAADPAGHATALLNLAIDKFGTGQSEQTDALAQQALAAMRVLGSPRGLANALIVASQLAHVTDLDRPRRLPRKRCASCRP
jgi:hypothetical protein